MPKNSISAPKYCWQKQTGRPDCAYVNVDGKRVMLGNYGFPDSYEKYAEAISGNKPKAPDDKKVNPNKAHKPKAVLRTVGSNMKSEPIDPSMLEKVREILRARGFEGYQKDKIARRRRINQQKALPSGRVFYAQTVSPPRKLCTIRPHSQGKNLVHLIWTFESPCSKSRFVDTARRYGYGDWQWTL